MLKKVHSIRLNGEKTELEDEIAEETPLVIFVNGRHFTTAMISPQMQKEFVIGHLFSEGIIKNLEDIEHFKIEDNNAKVLTNGMGDPKIHDQRKIILSGCGSTSSFLDEKNLPKIDSITGLKTGSKLGLDKSTISDAMKTILRSDNFKRTGGVHSCGLFNKSGLLIGADDIGRHNALDKVIGSGLIQGDIEFSNTFLVTTGRVSSDVVLKCSKANIPLIASKGAVTTLALDIAEKTGLAVVGFVRGNRMTVYRGNITL